MTLQIKEGKFYATRGGRKAGPASNYGAAGNKYGWAVPVHGLTSDDGFFVYTDDGRYSTFGSDAHLDLVAEWVDEPAKEALDLLTPDPVERPAHYTGHPSGVECIQITEHMNFCRGNAIKYIWRAGEKGDEIEDLKKAAWSLQREISRLTKKDA